MIGRTMKDDVVPTYVRIPEPIKRRLDDAAEKNDRSVNGEIVRRLRDSFRPVADMLADVDYSDLMTELIRRHPPGDIIIKVSKE